MNATMAANGRKLYEELQTRMARLQEQGLLDFKMKLFNERDTSVNGVVLTLNNALRLLEEGEFKPIDIR